MTSTTRGPYAKTAELRRRVIEAALQTFTEFGYQGLTVAEVARRAGLSHTGLRHHFASKEELLVAVLEASDADKAETLNARKLLSTAADPLAVLTSLVDDLIAGEAPKMIDELDVVLTGEAAARSHPAHGYVAERFERTRSFAARRFRQLDEEGRLAEGVDPELAGSMLLGLVYGINVQRVYDQQSVDSVAAIRAFLELLTRRNPDLNPSEA